MAFVNLPPNLQDMFYSITDRIAKLETGPNQAMYTAEAAQGSAQSATAIALSAQSVATQAQIQAINAGIQANNAASQATIAQSQATIASSQATAAQVTANGKNKVYYSTTVPGSTANTVGDIWYQYGTSGVYLNKVIAQFSGAGGTSWTPVTVSGLVIANIDAGSITTGTLSAITISAGSGANAFNVSSSGVMSAQGAWIKGNITADSGTFNGTVNAATGYFGNLAGGNYWSIGASGLTAVGSGTITGGLIQGSSITVPNSASWKFAVDSAGSLQAVNANITGAIFATSGTFTGTVSAATIIGSNFQTTTSGARITINDSLDNSIKVYPDSSLQPGVISASTVSGTGSLRLLGPYTAGWNQSSINLYSLAPSTSNIQLTADVITLAGGLFASQGSLFSGSAEFSSTITYPGAATAAGSNLVLVTTGKRVGFVSSSRATKKNIEPIIGSYIDKLLTLEPVAFDWKDQPDDMPYRRNYGLIAEDVADLDNEMESIVNYNDQGLPITISYERLCTFLVLAVKELQQEINKIRGQ
jgi:hypothetical protein